MIESEAPASVQLVDEAGAPASQAQVEIFATPPLDVGDTAYRSPRVAVASVRDDGTVEFPVVPVAEVRRFANGDYLNLEFDAAVGGGGITSWSYSVELPKDADFVSLAPPPEDLSVPVPAAAAGRRKAVRPTLVDGRMGLGSAWPAAPLRGGVVAV